MNINKIMITLLQEYPTTQRCHGLCDYVESELKLRRINESHFLDFKNILMVYVEHKFFWPFPFNPTSGHYSIESCNETCHLNPLRLAAIETLIAHYKKLNGDAQ